MHPLSDKATLSPAFQALVEIPAKDDAALHACGRSTVPQPYATPSEGDAPRSGSRIEPLRPADGAQA
jgi:hypothetical protein